MFEREVTRLQTSNSKMSHAEASKVLLNKMSKQGKEANLSDYELLQLNQVMERTEQLIAKDVMEEQELKDGGYEKSYMFKRVQRLLREKEGQSTMEVHTGVSELIYSPSETLCKLGKKQRVAEPRNYKFNV